MGNQMQTKSASYNELIKEIKNFPDEYLPALSKMVKIFRESIMLNPAEDSFKIGLNEALKQDTVPISSLWKGIDE